MSCWSGTYRISISNDKTHNHPSIHPYLFGHAVTRVLSLSPAPPIFPVGPFLLSGLTSHDIPDEEHKVSIAGKVDTSPMLAKKFFAFLLLGTS